MKKTLFIRIKSKKDFKKLEQAAKIIKKGNLVAFPTETVYGLGANALDSKAVSGIFKAKGRPSDNPLIVHIADKKDVYKLTKEVPLEAEILMKKFWPGPLTIVLKRKKIVPKIVSAGLNTVAIRMPKHDVALELIKRAKVPIAAPSANVSGRPSPTSAKHVIHDLFGKIDAIIDGGEAEIGIESTVIDLSGEIPTLLRPGKITPEQLEKELGIVKIHGSLKGNKKVKVLISKSPGMKYIHYAPNAKVILVVGKNKNKIKKKIYLLSKNYKLKNKTIRIIEVRSLESFAKNIFRIFRGSDKKKIDVILVPGVEEKGLGLAIMNRLKKAASEIIRVR